MTCGIFACLQADKDRRDMDLDKEEIDADKMSRFIRMNELRLVTEYNPTVISSSSLPSPQHPASPILAILWLKCLCMRMCAGVATVV